MLEQTRIPMYGRNRLTLQRPPSCKGNDMASVSGNAHQRATRKKAKEKYPIQKGEKMSKRKDETERKEETTKGGKGDQCVDIFVVVDFDLFLSACRIAI